MTNFKQEDIKQIKILMDKTSALALEIFAGSPKVKEMSRKRDHSLVSRADIEVESLLRKKLRELFPEINIIGEEEGGQIIPPCWVIDPIDGTSSFVFGLPLWTISLGLIGKNGLPELGFLALPCARSIIWQDENQKLYLNETRIQKNARINDYISKKLNQETNDKPAFDSDTQISVPSVFHRRLRMKKTFPGKVRSLGSTALHGSYIATGNLTCGVIGRPKLWDIAASWSQMKAMGLDLYMPEDEKKYKDTDWIPVSLDYFSRFHTNTRERPPILLGGSHRDVKLLAQEIDWTELNSI